MTKQKILTECKNIIFLEEIKLHERKVKTVYVTKFNNIVDDRELGITNKKSYITFMYAILEYIAMETGNMSKFTKVSKFIPFNKSELNEFKTSAVYMGEIIAIGNKILNVTESLKDMIVIVGEHLKSKGVNFNYIPAMKALPFSLF